MYCDLLQIRNNPQLHWIAKRTKVIQKLQLETLPKKVKKSCLKWDCNQSSKCLKLILPEDFRF